MLLIISWLRLRSGVSYFRTGLSVCMFSKRNVVIDELHVVARRLRLPYLSCGILIIKFFSAILRVGCYTHVVAGDNVPEHGFLLEPTIRSAQASKLALVLSSHIQRG